MDYFFLAMGTLFGFGSSLKKERTPTQPRERFRGFRHDKEAMRKNWNKVSPLHRFMNPW